MKQGGIPMFILILLIGHLFIPSITESAAVFQGNIKCSLKPGGIHVQAVRGRSSEFTFYKHGIDISATGVSVSGTGVTATIVRRINGTQSTYRENRIPVGGIVIRVTSSNTAALGPRTLTVHSLLGGQDNIPIEIVCPFECPPDITTVDCNKYRLFEHETTECRVTLNKPAPCGGAKISMSYPGGYPLGYKPNGIRWSPDGLKIPEGRSYGTFSVTAPSVFGDELSRQDMWTTLRVIVSAGSLVHFYECPRKDPILKEFTIVKKMRIKRSKPQLQKTKKFPQPPLFQNPLRNR
jgi:hypothetical protein